MDVDLFPFPTTIYILFREAGEEEWRCWARDHAGAQHVSSRCSSWMEGRKECGAAQINLTDLADPPPHEVLSQDPGFFQDRGNTCKRGETEWKNYPSGLFSLDTRDKRFPPLPLLLLLCNSASCIRGFYFQPTILLLSPFYRKEIYVPNVLI